MAVATALTLGFCAVLTAQAPIGAAAGSCGAGLGDYRGEFAAVEDPSSVLSFDGAGGIAFRSGTLGAGEGIYATIPSGGFSATLRMSDSGSDNARPDNATSMVKSVTFACPAPGTQVASFNSLDQSSRRFNFVRTK